MSVILNSLQAHPFTPSSAEEYLALQLAKKLDDESSISKYLRYVERNSALNLAKLFHQAKRELHPADAFHSSLTSSQP